MKFEMSYTSYQINNFSSSSSSSTNFIATQV